MDEDSRTEEVDQVGSAESPTPILSQQDKNASTPSTDVDADEADAAADSGMSTGLRVLLAVSLVGVSVALYQQFGHLLTIKGLKEHRHTLITYVEDHPVSAPLMYIGIMTCVIGFNVPGATALSLSGGFLFQQPLAALCSYIGTVTGASIAYFLVRTVFGESFRKAISQNSPMFRRFQQGMQDADNFWDTLAFLVFVRYIAFFPFWFVNGSCAILSVGYSYFLLTTAVACIPGSVLYTMSGRIIGKTIDTYEDELSSWDVLKGALFSGDREMQVVLGILMGCIFIPLILKVLQSRRKKKEMKKKKKKPKMSTGIQLGAATVGVKED